MLLKISDLILFLETNFMVRPSLPLDRVRAAPGPLQTKGPIALKVVKEAGGGRPASRKRFLVITVMTRGSATVIFVHEETPH